MPGDSGGGIALLQEPHPTTATIATSAGSHARAGTGVPARGGEADDRSHDGRATLDGFRQNPMVKPKRSP
jgi:hypothetical protein